MKMKTKILAIGISFLLLSVSNCLAAEKLYEKSSKKYPFAPLGVLEDQKSYIQNDNTALLKELHNKGTSVFNLVYYHDTFDYKDRGNIYKNTYQEGEDAHQYGSLQLSQDFILSRGLVNFGMGLGAGVSFNRGKGTFTSDGTQSPAEFKLWMIPVDLDLLAELPIGKYSSLSVVGGPSVMILSQTRNDFVTGEKYKHRRQASWGYFGKARVKLNLSQIFSGVGFNYYKMYQVTKFALNIEARIQDYSHFQDEDISMTGVSFGAGFSFEYL